MPSGIVFSLSNYHANIYINKVWTMKFAKPSSVNRK